jgi:DNA-binding transcriptional MerR regulator
MSLTVSHLGAEVGLSAATVRYYERLGLLPPAQRTAAGYRQYQQDAVERLRFIKSAQRVGLRLREIAVFAAEGVRVLRTPVRAPRANAYAERWVGTVRREVLDRMLIVGGRQLRSVLAEYADHYNGHRPHRALGQTPPLAPGEPVVLASAGRVVRRDRLGGLIHEYAQAA